MSNPEIDILIVDKAWKALDLDHLIPLMTETVFTHLHLDKPICISIKLTNDREIRALNKTFRQKEAPTNVLAFPVREDFQDDAHPLLGDIVFAYETIAREATDQGKKIHDHFAHLLVHGLLHLLGYDHMQEKDAEQMETLEINILKLVNIKDPYHLHG